MITIIKREKAILKGEKTASIVELRGLSTDTKPTTISEDEVIENGSIFIEIDTGKVYLFDLENQEWKEV